MFDALKRIGELRLVPVVSIDDAANAAGLGEALMAGGLPLVEITFRTEAAEQSIKTLARQTGLLVGAGTILNIETAKRAVDAGARFLVSPGFNPKVVDWCVTNKVAITPGIATPTEIEMALDHGLDVVKFFPAESIGGTKTLKAFAAPYAMVRFMPTGGIGADNVSEYLKIPSVLACGGSWMATREMIAAKAFDTIRDVTRIAILSTRPGG